MTSILLILSGFAHAVVSPKPFHCNGVYGGLSCTTKLQLNNCKHSIKIYWPPIRFSGDAAWLKKHRGWCTITFDGKDAVEEKKLPPEKCDALLQIMAGAYQGFPEVKWQDSACTHISGPNSVLYLNHQFEKPVLAKGGIVRKPAEPEPVVVALEDVNTCTLVNPSAKKRVVHCPVLTQRVHSWMRKFLAALGVGLVLQNPLR